MDELTQTKEKILELQSQLESQHPQIQHLLYDIWKSVKANPEQATLLEETEIQIIVNGLKKQTATEIASNVVKSKKGTKNIGLADL